MARPVVLSNGELHVGINKFGLVHDFYFPYVGFENHSAGKSLRHRVGVWIDGQLSWLDDGSWELEFDYPHLALVGHTIARHRSLGVILEFDDFVDSEVSAFIRSIHVINSSNQNREIRLFMHQAFAIGDSRSNTDTAQYMPDDHGVLHYRGRRAFLISARDGDGVWFDQYSIGLFDIEGREGTYRDADDGELSMSKVEHGRVDSTIRLKLDVPAHGSKRVHYWVAAGTSVREAVYVHNRLSKNGVDTALDRTARWWHKWLEPAHEAAEKVDEKYRANFLKSVMLIRSQIDKRGAVIASTDTAMLNYSRDTYAYCWPRDGAHVVWPLIRMGYKDEPYRFFDFCRRALSSGGYLMHKFRADGALGSSWHPYLHENGESAPPIQEDETALVLFVFSQFYQMYQDKGFLKEFYEPMVVPMANFLASYVDAQTGLPKPTYDLWEEQYLATTYTTAVTYAALLAAADMAEVRSDSDNIVKWRAAAEDIQQAAQKHLYDRGNGVFYKGVRKAADGTLSYDSTVDMSAIYGTFMFGLFPLDSDEVKSSVAKALEVFEFSHDVPGLPRYQNDSYHRTDSQVTGNWWYISSLWLAQYSLEVKDEDTAYAILDWVTSRASTSGALAEQVDPITGDDRSVSPLTWSQAEYVSTLLDTAIE